jgi:hypothetical protein
VITAGRNIVAIGGVAFRPPIIICYVPAPDVLEVIRPELRTGLLQSYVDRKVITPQLQERLLAGK